jgi:hypothetical protein
MRRPTLGRVAGSVAVAYALALLAPAAASADLAPVPSQHIAIVSENRPSLPPVPVGSSDGSWYSFASPPFSFATLPTSALTPDTLAAYDTVLLYGVDWSGLSAAQQAAVNQFALTGKVVIWDADAVLPEGGEGDYTTFIHPFRTNATGAHASDNGEAAIVSGAPGNPLASAGAADPLVNPLYVDATALAMQRHAIGDMSVMAQPYDMANWSGALIGQNKHLAGPGWVVAWGYGVTAQHAGMTIYSGIDGDALCRLSSSTCGQPFNWARRVLYLQLAAPFYRGAAPCAATGTCAPPPQPPPITGPLPPGGGSGGGGGGNGGTTGGGGLCRLAVPVPTRWLHKTVTVRVVTSVSAASGVSVTAASGRTIASAAFKGTTSATLHVDTTRLASNHADVLVARVANGSGVACTLRFTLHVDNTLPRAVKLHLARRGKMRVVVFIPSEAVSARLLVHGRGGVIHLRGGHRVALRIRLHVTSIRLVLSDRAGNVRAHTLKVT